MGFMPAIPATEFGERKDERQEEQEQRREATCGAAAGVGRFGFCWRSSAQVGFEMRTAVYENERIDGRKEN